MKATRSVHRLLVAAALAAVSLGAVAVAPATPVSAVPCTMCSGGEFHPLDSPVRAFYGAVAVGSPAMSLDLLRLTSPSPLLGTGVQRSDVLSLAVTVTITQPGNSGWLKLFSTVEPNTSLMWFRGGQAASNWSMIAPDANGMAKVRTFSPDAVKGIVRLSIDVVGWFSTSSYAGDDLTPGTADDHGLRLKTLRPVRIATSGAATVTPTAPLTVPVATAVDLVTGKPLWDSVFGATVKAVMLNVTAVKASVASVISVQASDAPPPLTRSLSVPANDTVSTLVTARVGADGKVVVMAPVGATMITVDLVGMFRDLPISEAAAGRVVPLALPFRGFDTRQAAFGAVALGPKQAEDWSFAAFANSVQLGGLSVGPQDGLLGNLINASLTRQYPTVPVTSGLAIYRPFDALPPSSVVSTREGSIVANGVVMTYGTNAVARVYNRAGYAHYLLDVYAVVLS